MTHVTSSSVDGFPAHVREAHVLQAATSPVIAPVIHLGAGDPPGTDLAADAAWASQAAFARRQVLTYRAAGLDHGIAESNLQLIDRICSLIATWPEPEWTKTVRRVVERSIEARRSGRRRGEQLRQGRDPDPSMRQPDVGWLLRHPADHYLLGARAEITDPWICTHLDAHARVHPQL